MIGAIILAALASSLVTLATGRITAHAGVPAAHPELMLSIGDHFKVVGAPLGCRVVALPDYAGRVFVDCRRAGELAGRYGTLLSGGEALIVRFRDAHTAKVVFRAKQGGRFSKCE